MLKRALALALAAIFAWRGATGQTEQGAKSVLIVYHAGSQSGGVLAPEAGAADALTQPTTRTVNVLFVTEALAQRLRAAGLRVTAAEALSIREPAQLLAHDAIVIGTPTWFSNMAWPVKRLFDEHMIRIYERHPGRLRGKVMAGFCTVMERGESGPNCLKGLYWAIGHMNARTVEGLVANTGDEPDRVLRQVDELSVRLVETLNR